MLGRGRHLFWLAAIGCSSPGVATKRDVVAPMDQGAAAAVATRQEARTAPAAASSELPDSSKLQGPQESMPSQSSSAQQQSQRQPYTFEWERIRKNWEKIKATPYSQFACDPWTGAPTRKGVCCLPGVKPTMAAKVKMTRPLGQDRTEVWLDLGVEDLISKKWYAALIDEQGHPIMEWVPLEGVTQRDSVMIAPLNHHRINEQTSRVALVKELPE
jgi:hypothetical protein